MCYARPPGDIDSASLQVITVLHSPYRTIVGGASIHAGDYPVGACQIRRDGIRSAARYSNAQPRHPLALPETCTRARSSKCGRGEEQK